MFVSYVVLYRIKHKEEQAKSARLFLEDNFNFKIVF